MHDFDVIVVGARCAGAPTAMLLARHGHRVLLVDRATFPSDTLSTLVIHGTGVAALERWELLDRVVATGCPPIDRYRFDFGPIVIEGTPRPCDGISTAYAPRRTVLDSLLVDAAREDGADVREGVTIDEILMEAGTVLGIRGHGDDGSTLEARARVVVGADGWNSVVARAVDAPRYHAKPVLENAFYTFWRGLPVDAFTTYLRGDRGVAVIPTNDDLTLVLAGCPYAQARAFRADLEANYLGTLALVPELAKQLHSAERAERIVGGGVPNFFRRPFGPGWALVGDAGY
ncbi:MAG TPA: NAD(P)/FAD-dependent oxidoreductase, partial [Acidimicrobiales bacterium]|nr:NAD(P)/FAD-dependent oxidoreductase [Acidimicrobiales bacterium]